MKKELTYEQAVIELEALVKKIEDPSMPLGKISGEIDKALELAEYCKKKLREFETRIEELKE